MDKRQFTSVWIRRETHARLLRYRKSIRLPPSLQAIADEAITLYLDAHEAGK